MRRALASIAVVAAACTPRTAPPAAGQATTETRADAAPAAPATEGADRIGATPPEWRVESWINSPPLTLASLRGNVVLVRWFMSTRCPYCSATAPSLRAFDDDYAARGLRVIGFYHHKDPGPLDLAKVQETVRAFGFRFPVAVDPDWRTLRAWWLDGHERAFTSVSFLLDRRGVVRFVHPGGSYAPGSADERELRARIEGLLAEP